MAHDYWKLQIANVETRGVRLRRPLRLEDDATTAEILVLLKNIPEKYRDEWKKNKFGAETEQTNFLIAFLSRVANSAVNSWSKSKKRQLEGQMKLTRRFTENMIGLIPGASNAASNAIAQSSATARQIQNQRDAEEKRWRIDEYRQDRNNWRAKEEGGVLERPSVRWVEDNYATLESNRRLEEKVERKNKIESKTENGTKKNKGGGKKRRRSGTRRKRSKTRSRKRRSRKR